MLHIIFRKCKVDVMYFIFIFISPSVPRFSVKKSVNHSIKNKRPYEQTAKSPIFDIKCIYLIKYHYFCVRKGYASVTNPYVYQGTK